ncbi:hypothetical protein Aura_00101 [Pseudomonas phage vB_PpuM-Aura]
MPQYKVRFYHMVQGMDQPDERDLGIVEADDELSARKLASRELCLREGGDPNCSYTLSCISAELILTGENAESLSLMTKDEFWDVAKIAKPGITREEYDVMWDDFQKKKSLKELN